MHPQLYANCTCKSLDAHTLGTVCTDQLCLKFCFLWGVPTNFDVLAENVREPHPTATLYREYDAISLYFYLINTVKYSEVDIQRKKISNPVTMHPRSLINKQPMDSISRKPVKRSCSRRSQSQESEQPGTHTTDNPEFLAEIRRQRAVHLVTGIWIQECRQLKNKANPISQNTYCTVQLVNFFLQTLSPSGSTFTRLRGSVIPDTVPSTSTLALYYERRRNLHLTIGNHVTSS